jgi:hypothetical protein
VVRVSARIFLEVVAVLAAGLLLVVAFGVWRLSQDEPLRLGFLTPYLEEALQLPDESLSIAIGETLITWAGWHRTFDLTARDVRVLDAEGQEVAEVPAISLTMSVRALLQGLIAPTAIEIFQPKILLLREADGHFHFGRTLGLTAAAAAAAEAEIADSPVLPAIFQELVHTPDPDRATGYIRRASILDADLTFIDRKRGLTWHAPKADFVFDRNPDGLTGWVNLNVEKLGNPARLEGDLVYETRSRRLSIETRFSGVDLAALGLLHSSLMQFAGSDLAIEGRVGTSVGLDGSIGAIAFDFAGGPGRLDMPDVSGQPLDVQRLTIAGEMEAGFDSLRLDEATLELNGPSVTLSGSISGLQALAERANGDVALSADLKATAVSVEALDRYWPPDAGRNARDWVIAHITAGTVEELTGHLDLALPARAPGDAADPEPQIAASGRVKANGLTIHYLDPLPPVTDAVGTASFTEQGFNADFSTARVDGIAIEGARVEVTDFQKKDQYIRISGTVRASLADALAFLDQPRLGYVQKLGMDPADAQGTTTTELAFAFPAVKGLSFEQVAVTANSNIRSAAIRSAMFGLDISDGNFSLELDRAGMALDGTARFGGVPCAIRWVENFEPAAFQRELTLAGTLDAEARAARGFDYRPAVDGPMDVRLIYTQFDQARGRIAADFDLTATTLALGLLDWRKPAGAPASGRAVVGLGAQGMSELSEFSVTAPDLNAAGRGRFAPGGESFAQVDFDRLRVGNTALDNVAVDFRSGRPEIVVGGGSLDAEPLLRKEEPPPEGAPPPAEEPMEPFRLEAQHLDRVRLDSERSLENVRLLFDHGVKYWDRLEFDATLEGASTVTMRYVPDGQQRHQLLLEASDAGAALRFLKIIDDVRGGKLTITGATDDTVPERPLNGNVEISEFRLVNQPGLARLLSIATFTGLIDLLTGEGFLFERFIGTFTKTGSHVDIPLARAYGPSLGLTATGELDQRLDTIDVKGTIVPAYGINSILGNIPVIGPLLQGGEGEGLFAATYRATGKLSEPTFTVNPLAALAPGFLRGLFDIFEGGERSEPTALPEPASEKK